MVNAFFVIIIKEIRELACDGKNYSHKANVKYDKKMNRNSAFNSGARRPKSLKRQKVGLDEFGGIKAKHERGDIIERVNHKVAYANYVEADLACVPPKDIRASVKRKQKAGDNLQQNQRAAAVFLKPVSSQQKDSGLQTKKGQSKKSHNAYDSNCVVHI